MEETQKRLSANEVKELRKGLVSILHGYRATLGNVVRRSLNTFSKEISCHQKKPTFDKIMQQFASKLEYDKTQEKLEESLKTFLEALQKCGGPSQSAATDLTKEWSAYAREHFDIWFIVKEAEPEKSCELLQHYPHQRVMSQTSIPQYAPRQLKPSDSAQFGQHLRRHDSFTNKVIGNFDRNKHYPTKKTWEDHYNETDSYARPIDAKELTKSAGGYWEVSYPLSLEPLAEEPPYSITDPSLRYSDPDPSSIQPHTSLNSTPTKLPQTASTDDAYVDLLPSSIFNDHGSNTLLRRLMAKNQESEEYYRRMSDASNQSNIACQKIIQQTIEKEMRASMQAFEQQVKYTLVFLIIILVLLLLLIFYFK